MEGVREEPVFLPVLFFLNEPIFVMFSNYYKNKKVKNLKRNIE